MYMFVRIYWLTMHYPGDKLCRLEFHVLKMSAKAPSSHNEPEHWTLATSEVPSHFTYLRLVLNPGTLIVLETPDEFLSLLALTTPGSGVADADLATDCKAFIPCHSPLATTTDPMALDKNLFTLNFEESKIEAKAIDLVDPSGTVHYRKQWLPTEAGTYLISLSDPLSGSILATASAPAAASKEKVIELHNPSATVPLTFKGTLTFKWSFTWEEHDFEWRREACYMIRKPDPPVIVAVTKEPTGKIKTTTVQILDYNLNRFEINDKKGLEVVLLASLLTFGDYSEQLRAKSTNENSNITPATPAITSATRLPALPPAKPEEGWKEDQIAILQAKEQRGVNEVVIGEVGEIHEYVNHCVSLLNDKALLFITLRSLTPACVSKVVQVAEATKRLRYKNGYDDEHDLHQYVDMSFDEALSANGKGKGKAPRVIKLDDRPSPSSNIAPYQPPNSLIIHLSKISMPELEPKKKSKNPVSPNRNFSGHGQYPSEPAPISRANIQDAQATPSDKKEQRKSVLTKLPAKDKTSSSGGLRAKFNALTTRSTSPPPSQRPASAPQSLYAANQIPPPQARLHPQRSRSHQQQPSSRSAQRPPPPQQPAPRPQLLSQPPQQLYPSQQTYQPSHTFPSNPASNRNPPPQPSRPQSFYPPQPNPAGHAAHFPNNDAPYPPVQNQAYLIPPGSVQQPVQPRPTSWGFFGTRRP
ncbi:hypothetical protein BU17DRAFT_69514 [Hysterangium stoloniferum]|nr:hypothetical protein BU17DRAFT_69514 [Hysterangium stoloniferum]